MSTSTSSKKTPKALNPNGSVPVSAQLSPVGQLISESWTRLKTNFGTFAALFFIQAFAFIAAFGIAVIIGLAGGVGVGLSQGGWQNLLQGNTQNLLPVLATAGVFVGVLVLVTVVIMMVLALMFQGAIIAVAAASEKISVGEALRIGRSKVGRLWLVGIVSGFLVFGGFFFFLVPGLIFSLLFCMTGYAIVLDNSKPLDALRTSAGLVKQHFWEVLGRLLLLLAINIGVSLLLSIVMGSARNAMGENGAGLIGLILNMVVNIGMMGFSVVYMTLLYQQLRTAKNVQPLPLKWMAVIAAIGLILFGFMMVSVVNMARYAAKNLPNDLENSMNKWDQDAAAGSWEKGTQNSKETSNEDWETMFRQALEEATASGQVNDKDTVTNFNY